MSDDLRFATWLKAHRDRCGLSMKALSDKAGTSAANVQKLEGGSSPTLATFERICAALEVDPATYWTGAPGPALTVTAAKMEHRFLRNVARAAYHVATGSTGRTTRERRKHDLQMALLDLAAFDADQTGRPA